MKKIILSLICALLLTLTACNDGTPPLSYTCTVDNVYSDVGDGYLLSFSCPSFDGNKALTDTVYNYAKTYMDNYITYNHPGEGYYSYEIDSVTASYMSETLASFLCVGSYTTENATHPVSIVYTLNVDIMNRKMLEAEDIIDNFNVIAELFKTDMSYIDTGNADIDAEVSKLSRDELIGAYSALYGIYPSVYFIGEGDNVKLAISVETVWSLGGHAEFAIGVNRTKNALSEEILNLLPSNIIN